MKIMPGLTFKDAFTACLVGGGRYRNSCCPHNDGEVGVWYRAARDEDGYWPDHSVYDECGTAVSVTDFVDLLDSTDDTWEVEMNTGGCNPSDMSL